MCACVFRVRACNIYSKSVVKGGSIRVFVLFTLFGGCFKGKPFLFGTFVLGREAPWRSCYFFFALRLQLTAALTAPLEVRAGPKDETWKMCQNLKGFPNQPEKDASPHLSPQKNKQTNKAHTQERCFVKG